MNDYDHLLEGLNDEDRAFAAQLNSLAERSTPSTHFVEGLAPQLHATTQHKRGFFATLRGWLGVAFGQRSAWALNAVTLGVIVLSVVIFGALVFGGKPPRSAFVGAMPAQEITSQPPTATLAPTATETPQLAVEPTATRPSYHQMCPFYGQVPNPNPSLTPVAATPDPSMPPIPPSIHVVESGEDLCTILYRYWRNTEDFYVELILELNGMESVTDVEVGQSLLIPIPPPNRGEPHPGVPTTSCFGFRYVDVWVAGNAYGLDDAGNQVPCDENAPTPTVVVMDVSQTSLEAGFAVQQFTAPIPAGYTMTSHQVHFFDEETHVGTRYSGSGDAWFSLNQTSPMATGDLVVFIYRTYAGEFTSEPVTINGNAGVFVPIQSNDVGGATEHALAWNEDGFTFLMWATDLTKEQMIALAESVQ